MSNADALILDLIATGRQATAEELATMIQHVAQAPFASYLSRVPPDLRQELATLGLIVPTKLPSVERHLLKRVYVERQWPLGTDIGRYEADLHRAVTHPDVEVWTYLYYQDPYVGFLAPSHLSNVPDPQKYIFVAYSPKHRTLTTGYQASGADAIFNADYTDLVKHK